MVELSIHRETHFSFPNPRSIFPSSPSEDEGKGGFRSHENNHAEYPDHSYDEEEERRRMNARREDELAGRRNEILPREENPNRGKMEVMKMGDWVSWYVKENGRSWWPLRGFVTDDIITFFVFPA